MARRLFGAVAEGLWPWIGWRENSPWYHSPDNRGGGSAPGDTALQQNCSVRYKTIAATKAIGTPTTKPKNTDRARFAFAVGIRRSATPCFRSLSLIRMTQAPNKAGSAAVTAHPVHGAGERTSNINKAKTAAPKAATAQQAFIMTARIMARSLGEGRTACDPDSATKPPPFKPLAPENTLRPSAPQNRAILPARSLKTERHASNRQSRSRRFRTHRTLFFRVRSAPHPTQGRHPRPCAEDPYSQRRTQGAHLQHRAYGSQRQAQG